MRLIDADELMEHVWRDKLDSRAEIAKMVNNAHTVKDIPTNMPVDMPIDMDKAKAFMIGILLGFDQKHDEMDKFTEDIKRIFTPEQNKWIPVSERLPEKSTWVLVTCKNPDGYIFLDVKLINRYTELWDGDEDFIGTVLAWMPLPEPYDPQEREK